MHTSDTKNGQLYVVATPIGNLRDITLRAIDVLKGVSLIAAEDTRVTATLLNAHGISAPMMSLHRHNERQASEKILAALAGGQSVALVSDAGTPGISDPGALLVQAVWEAGYDVIPIPGPNAAIAALSAVGAAESESGFYFHGFLPARSAARRAALDGLKSVPCPLVFYEAPHRIVELVEDLVSVLGAERRITLARELTKRFESIHTCALGAALEWLAGDPDRQRGEFVVIISGRTAEAPQDQGEAERILTILLQELPVSQAAGLAAKISGARKNELYDLALKLNRQ
jgi:16S rRNA (cytidine1402-2'-O)-methyltransferase